MANFCPNCGSALSSGAKFCANCGSKISVSKEEVKSSDNYSDLLAAGAGLIAAVTGTAQAQPATDVNNFYGFTSNGLQEMTGSVDATNIVAHVASRFGVDNIAEYVDVVADGADELLDAAADAVGDVAGEAAGSLIDSLFDLI